MGPRGCGGPATDTSVIETAVYKPPDTHSAQILLPRRRKDGDDSKKPWGMSFFGFGQLSGVCGKHKQRRIKATAGTKSCEYHRP
jgi:hypothetical protein